MDEVRRVARHRRELLPPGRVSGLGVVDDLSTGTHHELPWAVKIVAPQGVETGEALVVVLVGRQDELDVVPWSVGLDRRCRWRSAGGAT